MSNKKISITQCILTVASVAFLLISNVMNAKQLQLPFDIVINAGMLTFPFVYLISNIFNEVYGYSWSRKSCYLGFIFNVVAILCFEVTIALPSPSYFENAEAFNLVLGSVPRTVAASFIAYMIGDFVCDKVFSKFKAKHKEDTKGFWFRSVVSSYCGQLTDCVIFLPLALFGQMPTNVLITTILFQSFAKTLLEFCFMPLTNFLVKRFYNLEHN